MQKIQNNRSAAPGPQRRGIWGAGRQVPGPPRYGGYGTVTAIQQRGWEPPKAPSLAEQAAAAARQRRLSSFSEAEQKELQAVHLALRDGGDVSSLSSAALHALEASPVLLAELESAARHTNAAAAAAKDLAAQQGPLTEYDCVMLTVRPSIGQGASPENPSCLLLRACTPRSSKPVDLAAAAQATLDLNEAILDEIGACDAPTSGSKVAALKAALTRSALQRINGVPEFIMRFNCRVSALTDSRLLRPNQKQSRIQLGSGLALEVVRMPDPWEQVVVTMKGLSSAVPMAQASLIVAALLKGAPYQLSAGARCKSVVGSGRELMGITIASACSDEQDTLSRDHNLYLTVRRDSVDCLPPVTSVLMVWPSTVAEAERSELTWVRFEVDAADGHTDTRRCDECGEDGHAAALCTAQSGGHRARFTCFATVPSEQMVARASGAARRQQQKGTTATLNSKQQQQQPQKQQRRQQQQQTQQAPTADGFAVAQGSTRAVNKQLNQQASRQPLAAAPAAGAAVGAPALQPAGPAHVQSAGATARLYAEQEAPVDAAVIAESEQLEQKRRLQEELDQRREALVMCLAEDGTVAPACTAQFQKLRAQHEASLTVLSQASAHATEAVRALSAAASDLVSPKGKGRYTPQGAHVHEQQVKAFKEATALQAAQLSTAQDTASRLQALAEPFHVFARALRQYTDNTEQQQQQQQHTGSTEQQHTSSTEQQHTGSTEQQLGREVQLSLQLDTAAQHSDKQQSLNLDPAAQQVADDIDSGSYEHSLSPVIRVPADSQGADDDAEANADVEADVDAHADFDASADAEANNDANAAAEASADGEPGATAILPAAEAAAEQFKPQVAATHSAQLDQRGDALLASRENFLDQAERCGVDAEQNRLRRQAAADGACPALQSNAVDRTSSASETEADGDSCGSGSSESSESECSDGENLQKATVKRQPLAASASPPDSEGSEPRRLTRSASVAARSAASSSTHNN